MLRVAFGFLRTSVLSNHSPTTSLTASSCYLTLVPVLGLVPLLLSLLLQSPAQPAACANVWQNRAGEFEEYLRTAKIERIADIPIGVTRPRRAYLASGGLASSFAWKPLKPGFQHGYFESYKSEIAAYELDKLLALNMVPPSVEKTFNGERGAAIMWVAPAKSFKDLGVTSAPAAPAQYQAAWNRQIVKAKMFHNLINDIDPNLGNWLVDPAWNLILIDFSRSFTNGSQMVHVLTRVDPDLWNKFKALTEASLTPVLSAYIGKGEIRSIIQRRDKMAQVIDKLIKEHGEATVFMRDAGR